MPLESDDDPLKTNPFKTNAVFSYKSQWQGTGQGVGGFFLFLHSFCTLKSFPG